MHPLTADDEPQRLAALRETGILDTRAETDFDDIAALAADICDAPIAMVSMVDADRQWFKARVGWDPEQSARDDSFCTHVVRDRQLLEIDDAAADPRYATNPAIAEHGVRFYAGAPMLLQDGHAAGTVCVMDRKPRHLTLQQRRALRSLARHAAAHLELRRYARTVGHTADRLRELDRLKDSFLASVSHELRTPLASVRGYIEVLLDEDEAANDPETVRRFLAVMQRNADRLLRLIDDLLLVARLHETGLRLDVVEVDLNELAFQATLTSRPIAEHKRLTLTTRTDGPVPTTGDPERLAQALNHLLFNAIKFTPAGGHVTVTTTATPHPTLSIVDTGVGVPAEDLPHVFDRFHRSSTADHLAAQGAGLGLTIVKAIIDAHHGDITVTSAPGEGTTVCLTLPATAG
ncbi:ATP-binding protein [Dactylosporangium siamense]|uniref:histidine kinase n=1 Tax=Dactylosporangium siamense TaxID=685454 RepID=A0A919PZ09_9ACTN|nr:ATP-binding protein [Dactylosporangium siamense]GIG51861.1 sensor histidine kinase [Dactylosporangium siamense]